MGNSHSSTMFPFSSCFVELLHTVQGTFILYLSRIVRNPGTACLICSNRLAWAAEESEGLFFFSLSVYGTVAERRAKQFTLNLLFRSYAQPQVGLRGTF